MTIYVVPDSLLKMFASWWARARDWEGSCLTN